MGYGLAAVLHRLLWLLIYALPGPRWAKLLALAVLIIGPTIVRGMRTGSNWRGGPPAGV